MAKEELLTLLPYILIVLTILAVFGKVVHFDYVWFDDDLLISKSFGFIKEVKNIPKAFTQDAIITSGYGSNYYRPLQIVSLIVDAQFCDKEPGCFHVSNLFFHGVFTLTLFVFLRTLKTQKWVSFFLAMTFAVHPAIAVNIAWIPGRVDVLIGIFFLLSFIFFNRWITKKQKRFVLLHLLFFNLALYTKELALVLIFLIPIYYLIIDKQISSRKLLVYILPAWLVSSVIWLILRQNATANYDVSIFDQISIANMPGILLYLERIVPIRLSLFPILRDTSLIPGIAVGIFLLLALYTFRKSTKKISFGYLWFLLLILPSLAQSEAKLDPVFYEHRLYLPLVGLFIAFSDSFSIRAKYNKLPLAAGISIILVFSLLTFTRIEKFRTPLSFWSQATIDSPHAAEAFQGLGYAYQFHNEDGERALPLYKKALDLDPSVAFAHSNLGVIYLSQGKYDEAEQEIIEELKTKNNDYAWLQLGRVYYVQKKLDKALTAWQQAYGLNPDYLPVNINLALVYADMGNYRQAKPYYLRSIELGGLEGPDKKYLEYLTFLENY